MAVGNLKIIDGMVVGLDYTLRLDDGEIVDTSDGQEPLEYLQGHQQIVAGLEEAMYGMSVGEAKSVEVAPDDGYGKRDPSAFHTVPQNTFPPDLELTPGQSIRLRDQSGKLLTAYVEEVRPDGVLLDFNHPLAGETLFFDVKVVSLRPATSEELTEGHAHDAEHGH